MLVPSDIAPFFSQLSNEELLQGDILLANDIGLKAESEFSPDFWLIITKSCDMAFRGEEMVLKNRSLSLLPLLSFKLLNKIFKRDTSHILNFRKKIILLGLCGFKQVAELIKPNQVEDLIKDNLSKFMFLPPDGNVLQEPMVIDFEMIQRIDVPDEESVKTVLKSKKLQLSSPFREKVAQRYALHFMSIGLNDDDIRTKDYRKKLKEYFTNSANG